MEDSNSIKTGITFANLVFDLECNLKKNSDDYLINITLTEEKSPLEIHVFRGDLTKLKDQDLNWKFFKSTKNAFKKFISKQIKEAKVQVVESDDHLILQFTLPFLDEEEILSVKLTKHNLISVDRDGNVQKDANELFSLVKKLESKIEILEKRIPKVKELVVDFLKLPDESLNGYNKSFEFDVINSGDMSLN